MSEMDGCQHSCIGYLFGLPLYHPMEDHDETINSNSLILGGGSGEHGMFIVKDLEGCLQKYIHFHGGDYPEVECEYELYWSIEECHDVFPKIRPFMDRIGAKSAEKAVILAMADFLRTQGGFFVSHWHHIKPETLRAAMSIHQYPWNIVEVTSQVEGLGKLTLDGETVWGVSFADEINLLKGM